MTWEISAFCTMPVEEVLRLIETTPEGLTSEQAKARQARYSSSRLKPRRDVRPLTILAAQFHSPIILILIFAALISLFLSDTADAAIILAIILVSALLGFWKEHSAVNTVSALLDLVNVRAEVWRDSRKVEVPLDDIVPGDVVDLTAGSIIPGDGLLLEAKDLFVDEAALTGESSPTEKHVGILPESVPLGQRTNSIFMGSHVVSGHAKAVILQIGQETGFGRLGHHVMLRPPETEFEREMRRFGYLLMKVTLLLAFTIFAVNVLLHRPVFDSFLFSMALAVGLAPQLLPAIVSANLSHGAKRMAQEKVIAKRLASIETVWSMNVLCSDKTGTLTEGVMQLHAAIDPNGNPSERVRLHAYLNAVYETSFVDPLDDTIRARCSYDLSGHKKLDEVPYDFVRKRLSILVATASTHVLITKGAVEQVLAACSHAETSGPTPTPIATHLETIRGQCQNFNREGFRTLGLAYRDMGETPHIDKTHEADMVFLGLLVFSDPVKADMGETVASLRRLGVALKIITGDHRLVAAYVRGQAGIGQGRLLTGQDLRQMTDEALVKQVNDIDVFAEVDPNQKERIIFALRQAGNIVGYVGDGMTDAPALRAADVGISVDSAVDVAKDAADVVLLETNLAVLVDGVREGRTTFANTLKQVFAAISVNLGNMFSMAGASLFLPFLPLLSKQILLTKLLTDILKMPIVTDRVDHALIDQPKRWDSRVTRKFMLTFGFIRSLFDYLTFGALLLVLQASTEQFGTGWLVESVISASAIVLVIRTRQPFFISSPGGYLVMATLAVAGTTLLLPYLPIAAALGLTPMPLSFLILLGAISAGYVVTVVLAKRRFYAAHEI
jgi:Mg2+-importing ATPase